MTIAQYTQIYELMQAAIKELKNMAECDADADTVRYLAGAYAMEEYAAPYASDEPFVPGLDDVETRE